MKTIQEMFPKGSKSFFEANMTYPGPKNAIAANVDAARGIPRRGVMNQTEAEFSLILETMKSRGEIERWEFEPIRLRWGKIMSYSPDFLFKAGAKITLLEVKGGFPRSRDIVRFKGCKAEWEWLFNFELHQKKDGRWTRLY